MATDSTVIPPPTSGEPPDSGTLVPLGRNRNFQTIWAGSTLSILGLEVADVGYPLVILLLTGSPGKAGLFAVVQTLCMLLAGLPAGAAVDRYDRRRLLLAGEGARALVTLGVAVALWQHHLGYGQLLVSAAVLGLVQPLSGTARMVLLRAVVPKEQLTAALTRDEMRLAGGALAGPPLGGILFGLARLAPFVFTATSFVLSFLCALSLRLPRAAATAAQPAEKPADTPSESQFAVMLTGVRSLWADPMLRITTLLIVVISMIGAPLSLISVVILREQGTPFWEIGVALSGMAIGGMIGATLIAPLHRRLRPGVLLAGVSLSIVALLAALSLQWGPWWLMGVLLVGSIGLPAVRVLVDVLIFRQVPDAERGRVISLVMTLFGAGVPLGSGLAGLLLENLSASHSMLLLAALLAAILAVALTRRGLYSAQWPAEQPDSEPAAASA